MIHPISLFKNNFFFLKIGICRGQGAFGGTNGNSKTKREDPVILPAWQWPHISLWYINEKTGFSLLPIFGLKICPISQLSFHAVQAFFLVARVLGSVRKPSPPFVLTPDLRPQTWPQPSGASLIAQSVKNLPAVQEIGVRSLGQEDPLEKETATHSSSLENPMNRGAWQPTVHEVTRVVHNLVTKPSSHLREEAESGQGPGNFRRAGGWAAFSFPQKWICEWKWCSFGKWARQAPCEFSFF